MEAAFELGSGFSGPGLSLLIRGILGSLFALWVLWAATKQYQLMAEEKMKYGDWYISVIKLIFILITVLVMIAT